jgi:hypothetical protein
VERAGRARGRGAAGRARRAAGPGDGPALARLKAEEADSGAVTLIRRFGSAANLNIHLHCLVLDGVYRRNADGVPVFMEVPAPTDEALQTMLHTIITRLMKLLTRKGGLVEEEGSTYMADDDDSDDARVLRPLQAAACTYRIAFEPRAGQKVLTVQGAMPRDTDFKKTLCADIDGFSLHAAGAGTVVPLHHAPCVGQRARANQRRRARGAEAEDHVPRWDHAPRAEAGHKQSSGLFVPAEGPELCEGAACKVDAARIHAAACCAGAAATPAPDPFGVRVTSLREVSEPPLREPRRPGNQRQVAGAGGAARARSARARCPTGRV